MLNLLVNAVESMPEGGIIEVLTKEIYHKRKISQEWML